MSRTEPTIEQIELSQVHPGKSEPVISFKNIADDSSDADLLVDQLAASVREAKMLSPTCPHLNDFYRKTLLSQRWLEYREAKIKQFKSEADFGDKKQQEAFQRFFEFERTTLSELIKNMSEKNTDESGAPEQSPVPFSLGVDEAMVMAYQSSQFDEYVQKSYPDFYAEFEKEIQGNSDAIKAALPKTTKKNPVILRAAGIELMFKKAYPGLAKEIESRISSDVTPAGEKENLKRALSLVKAASWAVNPSGAFISYAVGAILKTETMKPVRDSIARAVTASQDALLKPAAKKIIGVMPGKLGAAVVVGCTAATVAGLYFAGVIKEEDAVQIAQNVMDSVGALRESTLSSINSLSDSFSFVDAGNAAPSDVISSPDAPPAGADALNQTQSPADLNSSPSDGVSPSASTADVLADLERNLESTPETPTATPADVLRELNAGPSAADAAPNSINAVAGSDYKVMSGDCLSVIAEKALKATGEPYNYGMIKAYYEQIALLNNIPDVDVIKPGQVLELPSLGVDSPQVNIATPTIEPAELPTFEPVRLEFDGAGLLEPAWNQTPTQPEPFWNPAFSQQGYLPDASDLFRPAEQYSFTDPVIAPTAPVDLGGQAQSTELTQLTSTPRMRP